MIQQAYRSIRLMLSAIGRIAACTLVASNCTMLLTPLLAGPPKILEEQAGKVAEVISGDSMKVIVGKETLTVRLEGIDAPEKGQAFEKESKGALAKLLLDKSVSFKKAVANKYGRVLGFIEVKSSEDNGKPLDASSQMLEQGWAWHFKKYNDEQRLADAEASAKKAKRGLWADDKPVAPWDYRGQKKITEVSP